MHLMHENPWFAYDESISTCALDVAERGPANPNMKKSVDQSQLVRIREAGKSKTEWWKREATVGRADVSDGEVTCTEIGRLMQLRPEVVADALESALTKLRGAGLELFDSSPARDDYLLPEEVGESAMDEPCFDVVQWQAWFMTLTRAQNREQSRENQKHRSVQAVKPALREWRSIMYEVNSGIFMLAKKRKKNEKRQRGVSGGPSGTSPAGRKQAERGGRRQHRMGASGGDDGE
jgi:hypothetical protein